MVRMRFKLIGSPLEIDGGMLVVKDASGNVLVTVYQPTTTTSEWNASSIYYSRTSTAWPSGDASLNLEFSAGPPSSNSEFVSFNPGTYSSVRSPGSSSTVFVASDQSWGFDLSGLTGTGSSTGGSAMWWNVARGNIDVPSNTTLSNNTSLSSSAVNSATDSPG